MPKLFNTESLVIVLVCCFSRIHNALKGIPDDRDGLFDTIQRSKNHYQKRAYQCIKCMVALFSNCPVAYQILQVIPFILFLAGFFPISVFRKKSQTNPTIIPFLTPQLNYNFQGQLI